MYMYILIWTIRVLKYGLSLKIKKYIRLLLLAHADIRFPSAEPEQPESSTVVYRLFIYGTFVLCLYRQNADHVLNVVLF